MRSLSSLPKVLVVWVPLVAYIGGVVALDVVFRGHQHGIMAALGVVPALALAVPQPYRHLLFASSLGAAAALSVSVTTWNERPFVIVATILNIALLIMVISRFWPGAWRGQPDAEDEQGAPTAEELPAYSAVLGGLRLEMRCLPAADQGEMLADLCDIRQTPFGTRLIVADLMGKDQGTRAAAEELLYHWQRTAGQESSLSEVARSLDRELAARHGGLFAKALLVGLTSEGRVELVCCGHSPPLLLGPDRASEVGVLEPLPPLGLFGLASGGCAVYVVSSRLDTHQRLLISTDGAIDPRGPGGVPFPLADRARALEGMQPAAFLETLRTEVLDHYSGHAPDEALLLLIERDSTAGGRVMVKPGGVAEAMAVLNAPPTDSSGRSRTTVRAA